MDGDWLTTVEVAALFGVKPYTVRRWAAEGRLASIKTRNGHQRFEATAIRALVRELETTALNDRETEGRSGPSARGSVL